MVNRLNKAEDILMVVPEGHIALITDGESGEEMKSDSSLSCSGLNVPGDDTHFHLCPAYDCF